jgi:hypothetical protein
MGKISVVIALAFIACLSMTAFAQGPKNEIVEPAFPPINTSGSEIYQEVREGADTVNKNINDAALSFRNESLFIIRADTGMSPHVPADKGVRTPSVTTAGFGAAPVAGSWAFTLTDVSTRFLKLDLNQTSDAVFGSGALNENGAIIAVTAAGTVLGDRLALFVTPVGSSNLFRLSLTIKQGSLDGDYIFTALGVSQPGVAFGSLISSQSTAATTQAAQPIQPAPMAPPVQANQSA